MKGTRSLDNHEIRKVAECFDGIFEARNRGLFMLGVSTGGRISELLSLTIGDVYQNRAAVTDLLYDKSIVKGGEVSRAVPVKHKTHSDSFSIEPPTLSFQSFLKHIPLLCGCDGFLVDKSG